MSHPMRELIAIREVLREIQTYVISRKPNKSIFRTHSKAHTLDTIPQSTVYDDNEAYLKFGTMPKISQMIKYIGLSYHFFCTKVDELEIKVINLSTHNQLVDKFTKGLTSGLFVKARKVRMW